MAGGMRGVPVTDPSARAEPVPPAEWKRMLEEVRRAVHGRDALWVVGVQEHQVLKLLN